MENYINNDNGQRRQGDVLLIPVDQLPCGLDKGDNKDGMNMLAYGESTGHAHFIKEEDAELFAANDNLKEFAKQHGITEPRNVVGALELVADNTELMHGTPRKDREQPQDYDHTSIPIKKQISPYYLIILPREYSDEEEFVRVAD